MSYCLNPQCQQLLNGDGAKFCLSCGSRLLLGDRYRAIKPLSQGGFGRTFLAVDEFKPSRPPCVIKQFFPQCQNGETAKKAAEMFRNEAISLEQLGNHPQIAELLAYFDQDKQQYLVEEFIEGKNLDRELAENGAFNETQIRQLLNDLLLVLRFVHERQIIHRDIKPANIIRRSSDRQLVLVDFGAAKLTSGLALELTGTVIGSAGYTAPEQLLGKAVFTSDLYSLGVTCIHLLTQLHPINLYDTREGVWVWRKYLKHPISDELTAILDKLLEAATAKRYPCVEEVLNDLNLHLFEANTTIDPVVVSSLISQPLSQKWKYIGTIFGHSSRVLSLAFSPDGKTLASSSENGTIKRWSFDAEKIQTGSISLPSQSFYGCAGAIYTIAFTPDGKFLVSGDREGRIEYLHLETGEIKNSFIGHSAPIKSIAISHDGYFIASAGEEKHIKVWRLNNQESVYKFEEKGKINAIAFCPNRHIIASGGETQNIKLWSLRTGKLIKSFEWPFGWVYDLAFSPDGKILAVGGYGRTIQFWDWGSEELVNSFMSNLYSVRSLCFSPDGQMIASGGEDTTIKIWCWQTEKLIASFPHHLQLVSSLAFSPDGKFLVSGSHDKSIKFWQGV
ncbi:protein kinase domain-containing protein [Floridanema evergladense]|uniref:Protein kinase n=1 Tax=Floridaenema evergladense BLCC-F167 TaxID=3153639 RepID=A0ABV4WHV3_9CYAN